MPTEGKGEKKDKKVEDDDDDKDEDEDVGEDDKDKLVASYRKIKKKNEKLKSALLKYKTKSETVLALAEEFKNDLKVKNAEIDRLRSSHTAAPGSAPAPDQPSEAQVKKVEQLHKTLERMMQENTMLRESLKKLETKIEERQSMKSYPVTASDLPDVVPDAENWVRIRAEHKASAETQAKMRLDLATLLEENKILSARVNENPAESVVVEALKAESAKKVKTARDELQKVKQGCEAIEKAAKEELEKMRTALAEADANAMKKVESELHQMKAKLEKEAAESLKAAHEVVERTREAAQAAQHAQQKELDELRKAVEQERASLKAGGANPSGPGPAPPPIPPPPGGGPPPPPPPPPPGGGPPPPPPPPPPGGGPPPPPPPPPPGGGPPPPPPPPPPGGGPPPPPPPPPPGGGPLPPPPPPPPGGGPPPPPPPPPPGGGPPPPPPPPPPGGGPPPPPPPPGGGPPPPPPPPGGGPPPPPGPPRPPGAGPPPPPGAPGAPKGKPKIKPATEMKGFFWKKAPAAVLSGESIWKDVVEPDIDIEILVERFGKKKVEKKEAADGGEPKGEKKKPRFVTVLEGKRYNSVAFMMAKLPPAPELARAVTDLDTKVVSFEGAVQLEKELATPEEMQQIREADTSEAPLDRPDAFIFEVTQIPQLKQRLQCWAFQMAFDEQLTEVMEPIHAIQEGIEQVRHSGSLRTVLGIVLAAGNYLNGGTARGQADGFDFESLAKLADFKDSSNRTTLLQFVVHMVRERHPGAVHLKHELRAVESASKITMDYIEGEVAKLKSKCTEVVNTSQVVVKATAAPESDKFCQELVPLLEHARESAVKLSEDLEKLKKAYKELLVYIGVEKKLIDKLPNNEFFGVFNEFANAFHEMDEKMTKAKEKADKKEALAKKAQEALAAKTGVKAVAGAPGAAPGAAPTVAQTKAAQANAVENLVAGLKRDSGMIKKKAAGGH